MTVQVDLSPLLQTATAIANESANAGDVSAIGDGITGAVQSAGGIDSDVQEGLQWWSLSLQVAVYPVSSVSGWLDQIEGQPNPNQLADQALAQVISIQKAGGTISQAVSAVQSNNKVAATTPTPNNPFQVLQNSISSFLQSAGTIIIIAAVAVVVVELILVSKK